MPAPTPLSQCCCNYKCSVVSRLRATVAMLGCQCQLSANPGLQDDPISTRAPPVTPCKLQICNVDPSGIRCMPLLCNLPDSSCRMFCANSRRGGRDCIAIRGVTRNPMPFLQHIIGGFLEGGESGIAADNVGSLG